MDSRDLLYALPLITAVVYPLGVGVFAICKLFYFRCMKRCFSTNALNENIFLFPNLKTPTQSAFLHFGKIYVFVCNLRISVL